MSDRLTIYLKENVARREQELYEHKANVVKHQPKGTTESYEVVVNNALESIGILELLALAQREYIKELESQIAIKK